LWVKQGLNSCILWIQCKNLLANHMTWCCTAVSLLSIINLPARSLSSFVSIRHCVRTSVTQSVRVFELLALLVGCHEPSLRSSGGIKVIWVLLCACRLDEILDQMNNLWSFANDCHLTNRSWHKRESVACNLLMQLQLATNLMTRKSSHYSCTIHYYSIWGFWPISQNAEILTSQDATWVPNLPNPKLTFCNSEKKCKRWKREWKLKKDLRFVCVPGRDL
jgi:hypothetical protein